MKKLLVIFFMLSACVNAKTVCRYIHSYDGMKYDQVKSIVKNNGYTIDLREIKKVSFERVIWNKSLLELKSRGYHEAVACYPTDGEVCLFLFKKGNQKLNIITNNKSKTIKSIELCGEIKWKR